MTPDTRSAVKVEEELEDANPEPTRPSYPTVDRQDADLTYWNGRSSKVRLVRPILHGDETIDFQGVIGPGEPCIHCAANGKPDRVDHQLHLRFSKDKSGRRSGPDAHLYEQLLELGRIAYTKQADVLTEEEQKNFDTWGVAPSSTCRNCMQPIERTDQGLTSVCSNPSCRARNGISELRLRDANAIRKAHREYRDGAKGAQRSEAQVLSPDKKAYEAQQKLTETMTETAKTMTAFVKRLDGAGEEK
jgi:hypothetical protein